jgi:hypothetical protein
VGRQHPLDLGVVVANGGVEVASVVGVDEVLGLFDVLGGDARTLVAGLS